MMCVRSQLGGTMLLSLRQEANTLRPGDVDTADVWLALILVMTAQCVQLVACCRA